VTLLLNPCTASPPPPLAGEGRERSSPGGGSHTKTVAMNPESKTPTWHVSTKLRVRSRSLRRNLTDAERIIWYAVRAHRLNGASFRRQKPIGPYIVDFVCHNARVIIEIDGAQHFEAEHERRDARRDAFLTARGYRVLRFNNHDVMTNWQGVLEAIDVALAASPSLPSPASGGGGEVGANRGAAS
jgi:very-short-patch-repair endonuclease